MSACDSESKYPCGKRKPLVAKYRRSVLECDYAATLKLVDMHEDMHMLVLCARLHTCILQADFEKGNEVKEIIATSLC